MRHANIFSIAISLCCTKNMKAIFQNSITEKIRKSQYDYKTVRASRKVDVNMRIKYKSGGTWAWFLITPTKKTLHFNK